MRCCGVGGRSPGGTKKIDVVGRSVPITVDRGISAPTVAKSVNVLYITGIPIVEYLFLKRNTSCDTGTLAIFLTFGGMSVRVLCSSTIDPFPSLSPKALAHRETIRSS